MNEITEKCIDWIRRYFNDSHGENAVVGISGGKDSTIVAKLCCEAIGKEHVIGVMMPNGVQKDLNDAKRVCEILGIRSMVIDISEAYNSMCRCIYNADSDMPELSEQTRINLAPRIRMATLYGVAQTLNGRVANTSNYDELFVGYGTLWGDTVGDFAPLRNLHVSQVLEIGDDLGLPSDLVHKAPADGLTGMTDEQKMGFTYKEVENYRNGRYVEIWANSAVAIMRRHRQNAFKLDMIDIPSFIHEQ